MKKLTTIDQLRLHDSWFKACVTFYEKSDLDTIIDYVIARNGNLQELQDILKQRNLGFPAPYIMKEVDFYNRVFHINRRCFIPRPDTEIMVSHILRYYTRQRMRILDLCCGSGVIGLTLAMNRPHWIIHMSDIDDGALKTCLKNVRSYSVKNVRLIYSNMFSNIKDYYDLIVTNPPYLRTIDTLDKSVLYEPHMALFSGCNGLYHTKAILQTAPYHSANLILEHSSVGYDSLYFVLKNSHYHITHSLTGFNGNRRALVLRRKIGA